MMILTDDIILFFGGSSHFVPVTQSFDLSQVFRTVLVASPRLLVF